MYTNCDSSYVRQTNNSFSIRWSAHRANWKKLKSKFSIKYLSDESALYRHYYKNHKANLKNLNIDNAYTVGFLEQRNFQNLDYRQHFWIVKLKSNINLAKTPYIELN